MGASSVYFREPNTVCDDVERFKALYETFDDQRERHEAGVETYQATAARVFIASALGLEV